MAEPLTEALDRLRRILRRTRGGYALVRVVVDDGARGAVLDVLRAGGEELPALRVLPSGPEGAAALEAIVRGAESVAEGVVVSDGDALATFDEGRVLDALNLARERLSDVLRGPLVLVLSPEGDTALASRAPDLRDATLGVVRVEDSEPRAPSVWVSEAKIDRAAAETELARILAAELPDAEVVDALIALGRGWRQATFNRQEDADRELIRTAAAEANWRAARAGYERGRANAITLRVANDRPAFSREERRAMLEDAIERLNGLGLEADPDRVKARTLLASDACLGDSFHEGARMFREQVIPEGDRCGDPRESIGPREAFLQVLAVLGRHREAASLARDEILPRLLALGDDRNSLETARFAAQGFGAAADWERAVEVAQKSLIPLARRVGDDSALLDAYQILMRAHARRGGPNDLRLARLYADWVKRLALKHGRAQTVAEADEALRQLSPPVTPNRAARRRARLGRGRA